MPELVDTWKEALPDILGKVTGRGVWTALNAARPITIDDGVVILGIPRGDSELAGHLRMSSTMRLIENAVAARAGAPLKVRVIDGITDEDYEIVKRRDAEKRRLQDAEMTKMRAELTARSTWDTVYEQLSRRFAAVTNRSLPQNKARFFEEAVSIIAETRKEQETFDDMNERNFARCLERVAQYTDVPSTVVAQQVMLRAGEL